MGTYKNSPPGVYKITCIPENKCYIGSSMHVKGRIMGHKYSLTHNKCDCPRLRAAWERHPDLSLFTFEILEVLHKGISKSELYDREDYWMKVYNSRDEAYGYNWSAARYSGENWHPSKGSTGYHHKPESRLKMRASWSDKRRQELSERNRKRWELYRTIHNKV